MLKKALIIRFGSLGDVILTTPVTRAIKEKYNDCEVHVLVKEEFAEVFKDSPYVDKIIKFDIRKGLSFLESFKELIKLCKEINENDYSVVIDLHRNLRSFFIRLYSNTERRLCYKKAALQRRLIVGLHLSAEIFKDLPHTVDKYLNTLKSIGIDSADRIPFIYLSTDNEKFADDFFKENAIKKGAAVFAISPGAKHKSKMYPKEKFVNLINMITDKLNAHVILVGSKADKEIIGEIKASIKNSDKVSSLMSATIKESAAVIKRCDKLITNDSGPMHIAVAVGTPVVAIFGPTDKRFGFYPLSEKDVVLTMNYDCSPCSLHGKKECVKYNYKCLNDITEERIFKELKGQNKLTFVIKKCY